ncbi:MAG: exodeoxyribonuclease VII large subunit [Bdellovibrionales bacterium]|nr:exodeoxyribonuclease VII large subunit [Bdellovibrionales bacterium]
MSQQIPSWLQQTLSLQDSHEDLQEDEPKVLSVSQLTRQIKENLEEDFLTVWVQGEISNFTAHGSGHFYFSLKDAGAQLSAVMFRGANGRLKFRPENGLEVIVRGRISVYEPRGGYQIVCETMEPVGAGALQKAYEQLKAKLQKEGLFDPAKKRSLPKFPEKIAIVTSPTGAAIKDMLNVLNRRNKNIEVLIFPCQVQGEKAAPEITQALRLVNQVGGFDVVIVGRGGGSIEDLWAFNDEGLARTIAASKIPVVSAVGHEIDFTIADFVADLRAPTPSAAAELVVAHTDDILESLKNKDRQMFSLIEKKRLMFLQQIQQLTKRLVDPKKYVELKAQHLDDLTYQLERAMAAHLDSNTTSLLLLKEKLGSPKSALQSFNQKLEMIRFRLGNSAKRQIETEQNTFERLTMLLDSLSPLKVLDRGYTITKKGGVVVRSGKTLKKGDTLQIQFKDKTIEATVSK